MQTSPKDLAYSGDNMLPVDGSNALLALAVVASGCDAVTGGAAELSWKLRPASSSLPDKFVECDSGKEGAQPILEMRLVWESQTTEGLEGFEQWPCSDSHGVTAFTLPAGPAHFAVVPVCEFGVAEASSFIAPAPEDRLVIRGDTVSLGAIELIVHVTDCGVHTCICNRRVIK